MLGDLEFWRSALWEPLTRAPWGDWRGFWLGSLMGHRNALLYFLPFLPILLILSRRQLRTGIILTGIVFIGFVFGPVYLFLWLLTCWVFYRAGEWYAGVVGERDPVPRWTTRLIFGLIIGHFLLVHGLGAIRLPAEWNAWLLAHVPWLLPMGARGVHWEPPWFRPERFQLCEVLLERAHDIGAAYLTMRMISYFSELRRRTIPQQRRTLGHFFAYLCYVPLLIQGPIERYTEFHDGIESGFSRRTAGNALVGLYRVLLGLVKCLFYTIYLYPWLDRRGLASFASPTLYLHPDQIASYALLFFGVHLQVLALYLVFSGYCDIAIGMSRLLGYRVIENYKRPWLAHSLTDMWRRWHISLSFILRDYIFFPLTRRRWNNTLNLLLTFLVCGIWHDFSGTYAAWGLTMGLLVAVNHRWTRWMRSLERHPQGRMAAVRRAFLRLQPLPRFCSWLLTINVFLMTGWICFGGSHAIKVVWELIRRPLNAAFGLHVAPW